MTNENIITLILIILFLLILAFMASQLDIDITPQQGSFLPNIKIKFSKDSSLFAFLRPAKEKELDREIENDEYKNKNLYGEATIQYGEDAITNLKYDITIKAQSDNINEYFYFNSDSGARFQREDGFKDIDTTTIPIREFDSWDGTIGTGIFSNLHRISLPIKKLQIGQELRLKYNVDLFGHFKELLNNADIAYHHFFFRFLNTTDSAMLKFIIPNGEVSKIIRFDFLVEYRNDTLLKFELDFIEGTILLPDNYGTATIRKESKFTVVYWNIWKKSPRSSIYKLKWYTAKV